jgi:hypothetical protein
MIAIDSGAESGILKHFSVIGPKMDIHKPFACTKETCSMKFKSRCDWKRHEETHYPQADYICQLTPECGSKAFHRKDKFLEHLKRCHDNHPYTPEMRTWQKPVTSVEAFRCSICGLDLNSWSERCEHVAKMAEECRQILLKRKPSLNYQAAPTGQGSKRKRLQKSSPGEGVLMRDRREPPTGQEPATGPIIPRGGGTHEEGITGSPNMMQRFKAQHLLLEIPRMNLL